MGIIQKRAAELKPGDVMVDTNSNRYAFQYASSAVPAPHISNKLRLHCFAGLGARAESQPGIDRVSRWMPPDYPVMVEASALDLTPAQQHAEELAAMVEKMADEFKSGWAGSDLEPVARALLDKIKPPKPPTLLETLGVVQGLLDGEDTSVAAAEYILDRARRAGVLK